MTHKFSFISGLFLIIAGGLLSAYNVLAAAMGLDLAAWRLAPATVAIVALLFVLPPFFNPRQPGLAGLFIPGMPILAVSVLLLASQLVTPGFIWSRFWPMILVALAIGFGLLGAFLRNIWLAVPAALTLALAAGLQLTALTGWWWMWAGLWALLPLALGLTLLVIGFVKRQAGLRLAGGILMLIFGTAGVGLVLLALLLWQAAGVVLGTGFTLAGLWLLWAAFVNRPSVARAPASTESGV
ncbi:MAG TPA: hypothetical protein PK954_14135 [Anaerolineales bacterium]|nr:hypothetical protein [Anaerolineales bacterium]HRF46879.1 hypothetical protein [Anaerolineales bacterium]